MKVLCLGDSNTWGYDPRSPLGERYGADSRWVDLLAAATGWTVCNLGQNGRSIPAAAPGLPPDADRLIVMLGTNDLLQGCPPQQAAERLARFLAALPDRRKLLLIAPPPLARGAWVPGEQLIADSRAYARYCRAVAGQLGIRFADAGAWGVGLAFDGVHFTAPGHRAFAAGLPERLRQDGFLAPGA